MIQYQQLEEKVSTLFGQIERSGKVVVERNGILQIIHESDLHDDDEFRYRSLPELTIAKATAHALGIRGENRSFQESGLTEEDKRIFVEFIQYRKLVGAQILGLLKYQILRYFNSFTPDWNHRGIRNHAQLLKTVTNELHIGEQCLDDEVMQLLQDYTTNTKSRIWNFSNPHFRLLRDGENYLHHMVMSWKPSIPSSNTPYMIFTRVKNSENEDKKHSIKWAEDEALMKQLEIYFSYEFRPLPENNKIRQKFLRGKLLADKIKLDQPKDYRFSAQGKSRLDELRERWYYQIEDSFGLTVVVPGSLNDRMWGSDTANCYLEYFSNHPYFELVDGSIDDHTYHANKPDELTFRIRVKREVWFDIAKQLNLPYPAETYMPDKIEVMVLGINDIIRKYLQPGRTAIEYKKKQDTKTGNRNWIGYHEYVRISKMLQQLSPVAGRLHNKKLHNFHDALIANMAYPIQIHNEFDINRSPFVPMISPQQESFFKYLMQQTNCYPI